MGLRPVKDDVFISGKKAGRFQLLIKKSHTYYFKSIDGLYAPLIKMIVCKGGGINLKDYLKSNKIYEYNRGIKIALLLIYKLLLAVCIFDKVIKMVMLCVLTKYFD
jgi:hypothetical protein